MNKPILNPATKVQIEDFLRNPAGAIGLFGEKWLDKTLLAEYLAEKLLALKEGALITYPYFLNVASDLNKAVTIEDIRSINDFILLKVPNRQEISRVIIISRADRMSLEAQNALLKNLEEPPMASLFILTVDSLNSLLPTITSRLKSIRVLRPLKNELIDYYDSLGYKKEDIDQALLVSAGLPGLMRELLENPDNEMAQSVVTARKLLSSSTFERLALVDQLTKDKSQLKNILFVIKQMSSIGIESENAVAAKRWGKILSATTDTESKLAANAQAKLLLTNYMLTIS